MLRRCCICFFLLGALLPVIAAETYPVRGQVIGKLSREPVPYAGVSVWGNPKTATSTDSLGYFVIKQVPPGVCRLSVSCIGYENLLTEEYIVSAKLPFIELELEEDETQLSGVTVQAAPFRRLKANPVSLQVIGLGEIEKSPGGNRDISRIVRSYPGVSFSPIGYRNDLIVRGGSPSENRFYMDGVEIPNINHFATQGASGGPVSILNADLIREVQFYTGVFPVEKSGALSSVMDIRLRDGDVSDNSFKATLGASEFSFSGSGHFSDKTTYLFSVRQSYLQLLFKLLNLPFLPNYVDGQFKVKMKFSPNDELVLLGLVGIDNMKLNLDITGESAEYYLSYLPRITQQTFTVGASYRRYMGRNVLSLTAGYNYLGNQNLKYRDNDDSRPENRTLDFAAKEQKSSLRAENRTYIGRWTITGGAEIYEARYVNNTFQRLYGVGRDSSRYDTRLGIVGASLYASALYKSANEKFSAAVGVRVDGCDYSRVMARFWENVSPNVSFSYRFHPDWAVSAATGIYHQLPPYTALGFKDNDGAFVNRSLKYMRVCNTNVGVEWSRNESLVIALEGFYKYYDRMPLSLYDDIPLACKGNDYGVVGNEALVSTAQGRAYGTELSLRWQIAGRLSAVSSLTLYRSECRNDRHAAYVASAWDNRFIANVSATYDFPRQWSVGAKLSAIGGSPYTPYDEEKSSLVQAWDVLGRPYYDYTRFNSERLGAFAQLDVRVDKNFYFRKWSLGVYVDLQNVTMSRLKQPDVPVSTGVIENPDAPADRQRYKMKYVKLSSGTLVPAIGVTVQF